ncbi:uncharacterized protein LOC143232438 [Tachypleus tridentatus]|uniref:uncharacterized protein LOC143232438 n=1 Tax=Tachypleus tridentatus TaxID=6853 RepID=UPI003FD39573
MTKFEEEMQSLQSKIENMELELRNCVLKKVDNLLVSQDCSRRDTSFRRNDNQSVTLGETVSPQEWENNLSRILSTAEGVRESSSSLRRRVESHAVSYNKEIVALWERSNTEFARIVELEQSTKTKLELLLSKVLYRLAKMTGQEQHLRTQIDIHQVPLDVASVRKHKMQNIPPNENSSDLFWQSKLIKTFHYLSEVRVPMVLHIQNTKECE